MIINPIILQITGYTNVVNWKYLSAYELNGITLFIQIKKWSSRKLGTEIESHIKHIFHDQQQN